ncbi:hypothetical protein N5C66_21035 [Rhizobium pusense]|uniref:hypothetical protein n=1 Tax=Agrobacterium pusense TaxID=648995 RepID=UPI00130067B1|nr:hypothetical protein [Agrobacterium pusense]MDH0911741.1 hypothetical protein [Agrobacterium pusense]MDH1097812.1 hypothetical protein [Agrobacterium pusense]MDH1114233.1 hypothetical protein [Agrobacterium pusense]MDH2196389.1 hypothetical protein [Agrobacterium pusense]
MPEDKHTGPETIVPANDNTPPNGDAVDTDITPWEKLERVVLDIARTSLGEDRPLPTESANSCFPRSESRSELGASCKDASG